MPIKTLSAIICSFGLLATANAAAPAFDNAADPAYNTGWPQSSNGGFGFSAWGWGNTAGAGVFVGDSSGNGNAPSGNINTNGRAWGMFAGTGNVLAARNFTAGGPNGSNVLAVGQVFSIQMDNGFVESSTNGQIGFTLLDTLGSSVFQFGLYGGNNIYTFNAHNGLGTEYTSIPYTDGGMTISFLLEANDNFTLTVTENGGGTYVVTSNITGQNDGNISAVQLFSQQTGSGPSHDLFFNNISVSSAKINVVSVAKVSNNVTIVFKGIAGATYQVQHSPTLMPPSTWTNVPGSLTADSDGLFTFSETTTDTMKFYRAIQ